MYIFYFNKIDNILKIYWHNEYNTYLNNKIEYQKHQLLVLTPTNDITDKQQLFVLCEGDDNESMKIETFTEHPSVITNCHIMGQHMQYLAPNLNE